MITPAAPIAEGATFIVRIAYTGRPGVHVDGDGSTEGWFRVNTTAAPNDGSFVTTEPVGTASWMPLNNHPSAKPTYDFYDTVNVGKTAIANGELVGATLGPDFAPLGPTSVNPPDANFPAGSWTWHWHSPEPIANYLVENSIGSYDLTGKKNAVTGIDYYQALASGLTAARKAAIKANLDQLEDITVFQEMFNGPYPFTTAGIIVALPSVGFAEEMQTKITFGNGASSTPSIGTINHEQMHQWFGDNVAEASFNLTFWKEGFATDLRVHEHRPHRRQRGRGSRDAGRRRGLRGEPDVSRFNTNYGTTSTTFWTSAPSNPTVGNLFTTAFTYTRPGTAYLALWQTLGRDTDGLGDEGHPDHVRRREHHGAAAQGGLPRMAAGRAARLAATRLDQFFPEWFDTSFPAGGANTTNKPKLSGPNLNGTGFVCGTVDPSSPTGENGWYTGDVSITWGGFGASAFTKTGCEDGPVAQGIVTRSCSVTTTLAPDPVVGRGLGDGQARLGRSRNGRDADPDARRRVVFAAHRHPRRL